MRENDWKAMVLTAFTLVAVICIVAASAKSCKADEEPEPIPATEVVKASEVVEIEEAVEVVAEIPPRHYVGRSRLTVYTPSECGYGYATATGVRSQHLMTCAVDPKVIPYGSVVIVVGRDGYEWRFRAVDCGGFSGNWIDIFFDDSEKHGIEWLDEAFGGDFAEVYWEEEFYPVIN